MMNLKSANVNFNEKGKHDDSTASSADYITDINNAVDIILSSPNLCAEFRSLLASRNIQTSAGVQQMMQKFAEEKILHLKDNSVENEILGGGDKIDESKFSDSVRKFIQRRSTEMKPPRRSSSELAPSHNGWSVKRQNHIYNKSGLRPNKTPRQMMPLMNSPKSKSTTDDWILRNGALIPTRKQSKQVIQRSRPSFANGQPKRDKMLSASTPANLLERSYNDSFACILETLNNSMPKLGSTKPTEFSLSSLNQHHEESLPGRRCSHMSTGSMEHLSDFLDISHKAHVASAPCHDSFSSMLSDATAVNNIRNRKIQGRVKSQAIDKIIGEPVKIEKIRAIPTNPAFRKWRRRESSLVDNHNFHFAGKNVASIHMPCVVDASSKDGLLRTWLNHEPKVFLPSSEASSQPQCAFPEDKHGESQKSIENSHKTVIHSFLGRSMKLFGISNYSLATTVRSPSDVDDLRNDDQDTLVSSLRDLSNASLVQQVDSIISEAQCPSLTNNNLLLDWGDFEDDVSDSSQDENSVTSLSLEDLEVR